jgi:hypothetical protein
MTGRGATDCCRVTSASVTGGDPDERAERVAAAVVDAANGGGAAASE